MEDIRELSINDLIARLHESIKGFISGMESVIGMNKEAPSPEIAVLRDHLTERLRKGEEITDNKRLIGFLDLLSKDQAVLELVKDDAKDWLEIVETIEKQIESRRPLSTGERNEIRKIKKMSSELKALIRE
ncbi:MAG: hypothetical protein KGH94_00440 [Candidatus Micrarchaeota archaeon]|nr:hypothetical protein [Candidatus Micrarchaeota archaeon]